MAIFFRPLHSTFFQELVFFFFLSVLLFLCAAALGSATPRFFAIYFDLSSAYPFRRRRDYQGHCMPSGLLPSLPLFSLFTYCFSIAVVLVVGRSLGRLAESDRPTKKASPCVSVAVVYKRMHVLFCVG